MKIIAPLVRRLALLALGVAALPALAQDFTRVGRIVDLKGEVSVYDEDRETWAEALRNRPVTTGDRLWLADGARAELRVGSIVLLLANGAVLDVQRLDDGALHLALEKGSMALRIPSQGLAEQTELRTAEALLRPTRAGQYRIDRDEGSTYAAALRGTLEASGGGQLLLVGDGERYEFWIDSRDNVARSRPARRADDRLAAWADESFRVAEREAEAWRHVSPDLPGAELLDRHGRWEHHPEYGSVWIPVGVSAGWRPFHEGRWVWMRPWGWTWVDAAPWGFPTSHYGRWVAWHGRWVWWPGHRHVRPVFTPALVSWVGNPGVSVSVTIGNAPPSAWVPLAPYQPYVPIVLPPPRPKPPKYPPQVPTGPVSKPPPVVYGPQGVPIGIQTPGRTTTTIAPAPTAVPAAPVARPEPVPPGRVDRPARPEVVEKPEKPIKAEKPEKPEKNDRNERREDLRRRDQVR